MKNHLIMKSSLRWLLLALAGLSSLQAAAKESEQQWADWAKKFSFTPANASGPVQTSGPWFVYSIPPLTVFSNSKSGILLIRSNEFECARFPSGELSFRFPGGREGRMDPKTGQLVISPGAGDIFPAFELSVVGGGKVSSSELAGKVYLVDFFASWCGPCRQYMPENQALFEKYKKKGLQVYGINIEGDEALAKKTAAELKVTFPILMAEP
ncbi:MAG: TlpA family protein disulfide reductase, partial [Spirochaetia bacterium]|nr:TlpA family protein disulfide reductase [Spirochaetia bacterium]